ncbi:hypothetical protein OsJ_32005 [Oryza sativa Japonica Group]|uniref:Uncharacterized protein n=1 Tax=Oryza sativa subsp. japonica TaxID=39947 RepID=B9G6E9_ORYSJ|nr:hypothetical protein OsJ_32005 [Oryza sativa Japonica Group]
MAMGGELRLAAASPKLRGWKRTIRFFVTRYIDSPYFRIITQPYLTATPSEENYIGWKTFKHQKDRASPVDTCISTNLEAIIPYLWPNSSPLSIPAHLPFCTPSLALDGCSPAAPTVPAVEIGRYGIRYQEIIRFFVTRYIDSPYFRIITQPYLTATPSEENYIGWKTFKHQKDRASPVDTCISTNLEAIIPYLWPNSSPLSIPAHLPFCTPSLALDGCSPAAPTVPAVEIGRYGIRYQELTSSPTQFSSHSRRRPSSPSPIPSPATRSGRRRSASFALGRAWRAAPLPAPFARRARSKGEGAARGAVAVAPRTHATCSTNCSGVEGRLDLRLEPLPRPTSRVAAPRPPCPATTAWPQAGADEAAEQIHGREDYRRLSGLTGYGLRRLNFYRTQT